MPLFIDRLPFQSWVDHTKTPPVLHWSVVLPVLITDAGLPVPPPGLSVQHWCLDTGYTGDVFAWRHHLLAAGLDPDRDRMPGWVTVTSSVSGKLQVPIRSADLWLVSNLPSFQSSPYRLALDRGIPFRNVPNQPDPHLNRPLVGMRTLQRAALRVELDYAKTTVSVWTPDPIPQTP
jgi:hypothetical protein